MAGPADPEGWVREFEDQVPGSPIFNAAYKEEFYPDTQRDLYTLAGRALGAHQTEHPNALIKPTGTGDWYLGTGPAVAGGLAGDPTPPVVYTDLETQQKFWEHTDNITGKKRYDRYDPKDPTPPAPSKEAIHVRSITYDKHTNTNVTELMNGIILTERAKELDPSIFPSESEAKQEIVNQGQVGKWQVQWEPGVGYSIQRIDDTVEKFPGAFNTIGEAQRAAIAQGVPDYVVIRDPESGKFFLQRPPAVPATPEDKFPGAFDSQAEAHREIQRLGLTDYEAVRDSATGRWFLRRKPAVSGTGTATVKPVTIGDQKFIQITQPDGVTSLREVEDLPDGTMEIITRNGREFVQVTQPNGQITIKELGPERTEAEVLEIAGRTFALDTSGNLQQLPMLTMEQIITKAILNNDWEAAVALDDFRNRPTSSEALQAALQFSRSPTDAAVISALARGEPGIVEQDFQAGADVQALGGVRRIGPAPEFLQTAYRRFQDSLLAGRPPTVDELLGDIANGGPSREESMIEELKVDFENLSQLFKEGLGTRTRTRTGTRTRTRTGTGTGTAPVGTDEVTTDSTGAGGTSIGLLIKLLTDAGASGVDARVSALEKAGFTFLEIQGILEDQYGELLRGGSVEVDGLGDKLGDKLGDITEDKLASDLLTVRGTSVDLGSESRKRQEAEINQLVLEAEQAEAEAEQAEAERKWETDPGYKPPTFLTEGETGEILPPLPPPVPSEDRPEEFEFGGRTHGAHLEIVGEAGPELVDLPPGTQVTPIADLTTEELAKLKEEGVEGFQAGGLVTNPSAFPLGIRQLLGGAAIAPARSIFPVAGLRVPSQQAQRRLLPSELAFLRGLSEEARMPGALFERELASTRPGRSGRRARFLADVAN